MIVSGGSGHAVPPALENTEDQSNTIDIEILPNAGEERPDHGQEGNSEDAAGRPDLKIPEVPGYTDLVPVYAIVCLPSRLF
jgi:hypothetical protein